MNAEFNDDDLARFESQGGTPLPAADEQGWLEHDGARIWHASFGQGPAVVLLHGGPYSYERMASDVLAVLDALHVDRARFVGWSDGACIALVLAARAPERAAGVFFFACNMDPSGTKEIVPSPLLDRCFARHRKDYAALSATPDQFDAFVAAVSEMMRTQPDYRAQDLAAIAVPVTVVMGEHDEFIRPEHAAYLARTIPGATLTTLPGVSHFAPLQRPERFNAAMLAFLERLPG
jgi:pimeloyl-ACP methyl ester carboxylesterase